MTRKLTFAALACCAPALCGCHAALWGNCAVFLVTVGIFLGTLSLGRVQATDTTPSTTTHH